MCVYDAYIEEQGIPESLKHCQHGGAAPYEGTENNPEVLGTNAAIWRWRIRQR